MLLFKVIQAIHFLPVGFKLKLILMTVITKIYLLLTTAPRVAIRLYIFEENNVIIA